MIGAAARAIVLMVAAAATAAAAATPAEEARRAAGDLAEAVAALQAAEAATDRIAAVSRAIRAYETGLEALRTALRGAAAREAALAARFEAERDRVARLLGVLSGLQGDPGPLLLLHPSGPLGTARAGMMLAEVTPALQAEAAALRARLEETAALRAAQADAAATLARGLAAAQAARSALAEAVARRGAVPRGGTGDAATLAALAADAATLDRFAAALEASPAPLTGAAADFAAMQGRLPLPVVGRVLRRAGEADAAGIRRPGLVIATGLAALVLAPVTATIRYRGPLVDYGNVMILEPAPGYLLVLAGMDSVFGEAGEIVVPGAPLGLMGGTDPVGGEFPGDLRNGAGATGSETLYMELRQGGAPVDPASWFIETKEQDNR
jgi:septal ring factor EnvC (AmiA/AmiB activator)